MKQWSCLLRAWGLRPSSSCKSWFNIQDWIYFNILRFDKPDDGLPVLEDWLGTFESMIFSGIELGREPLDCSMPMSGGNVVSSLDCQNRFQLWPSTFEWIVSSCYNCFFCFPLKILEKLVQQQLIKSKASHVRLWLAWSWLLHRSWITLILQLLTSWNLFTKFWTSVGCCLATSFDSISQFKIDYLSLSQSVHLILGPFPFLCLLHMSFVQLRWPLGWLQQIDPTATSPCGAERQAPNALQLALRFSKLMELGEGDGTHHPSMSTHERLLDVINVWHANSGLPNKHKLDDDKVRSVGNIVVGTCPVAWLEFLWWNKSTLNPIHGKESHWNTFNLKAKTQ